MRKVLVTLALLLCSAAASAACDWSDPGRDKYTGNYEQAMARYKDIPPAPRAKLLQRMNAGDYDEIVSITDTTIVGRGAYEPEIWGMHWGVDKMCMQVVRSKLQGVHTALAYTEGPYTVFVPSDCNNVARGTRLAAPPVAGIAPGPSGGDGGGGVFVPGGAGYAFERPMGLPPVIGSPGYTKVAYGAPVADTPPAAGDDTPPPAWLPYPVPVYVGGWYPGPTRFIEVPTPVAAVPEPATWATMALGIAAIVGLSYWRHRRTVRTRVAALQVLAHAAPKGLYANEVHQLMGAGASLLSVHDALDWLQHNRYSSMSIMRIDVIAPEPVPHWQTRALNYIEPAGIAALEYNESLKAWNYANK